MALSPQGYNMKEWLVWGKAKLYRKEGIVDYKKILKKSRRKDWVK